MNPITFANLKNFCFVCLKELGVELNRKPNKTNQLQPIKPLSVELLKVVTCLDLEEEDKLKQICQSCCIKVHALYTFREKAIESTGICRMLLAEDIKEDALPRLKAFCRLCLQRRTSTLDRYDLNKNIELRIKITNCTGLMFNGKGNIKDLLADDIRFPDVICEKCYTALWNFNDIQSIAKHSKEYIQNLIDENEESLRQKEINSQHTEIFIEQLPIPSDLLDTKDFLQIKLEPVDFIVNSDVLIDEKPFILENESNTIEHNNEVTQLKQNEDHEEHSKDDVEVLKNVAPIIENFVDLGRPPIEGIGSLNDNSEEEFDFNLDTPNESTTDDDNDVDDEDLDKTYKPVLNKKSGTKDVKEIKERTKIKRKKQLECKHCGRHFRNVVHFEGHVKGVHEGVENPFNCGFCKDAYFPDYNALQRHITRKHKSKTKETWDGNIFDPPKKSSLHICLQCNRQFTRKSHLQEHLNSVHLSEDQRPFKCQFCSKSFGAKKTLERHEKNHSSEKPFACEFCPKRYNLKADFNAHMQRHTCEDASLLCPICKRVKKTQEELQAHIEMHKLSRQHQCTTCGKIFTKLFHLKEHETTVHLKLRPFKCSICDKSFATQRSQKEHEQLHDPNAVKTVFCPHCNIGFISKKQLNYHTAKEHKEKVPRKKKTRKSKKESFESTKVFPLDWLA